MPSGMENLEGSRFIIRYEHPWGGIASDASKEDIAPNQFADSNGIFIRNGRLCSTGFYAFDPTYFKFGLDGIKTYMDHPLGTELVAIYTVLGVVVAIDRTCNTYYYDFGLMRWIPDQPGPAGANYSCSQMIKGVIYIFDWWTGQQLVYNPLSSLAVSSSFVGGKYCMTVDQYLITCNVNQGIWSSSTYPVETGREFAANRYNWSATQEAYTTWNPDITVYDPATGLPGDRSAGWNGVAEVQQEITGCFAMGNVGYILHDQGMSQITPTSGAILGETAIQPFDTTLLWGGKDGIGLTMPATLAVFGYIAIWGNNNNFYLFSGSSAPQEITGVAKRAIYSDINKFKYRDNKWLNVYGQICNTGVDNRSPELVYNIYIVSNTPAFSQPIDMIIWSYVIRTQSWTRHHVDVSKMFRLITGDEDFDIVLSGSYAAVSTQTFKFPGTYSDTGQDFFVSPLYGGILFNTIDPDHNDYYTFFLFQYINETGITSLSSTLPVTNLTFRTEEFQIYRKPTVRGVILRAAGHGTLHISIDGNTFTDIIVDSGENTKLYRSFGMYTDLSPTLNISSTDFTGFITKVHAFGTYAEGEPI